MCAALAAAVPGATEADVAAAFVDVLIRGGGALFNFAVSSGPSANTLAASHAPAAYTLRKLEPGDIMRIDAFGSLAGYQFDFARSMVIGGQPGPRQQQILDAARESVAAGVAAARPGAVVGDIARACENALARCAYARARGVPGNTMHDAWGRGIGLAFDPPWITAANELVLQPGMCLAVERRIAEADGLGAQYEDNVLITPTGPELLTRT
jgi:Xaa-Pro dipeptidase